MKCKNCGHVIIKRHERYFHIIEIDFDKFHNMGMDIHYILKYKCKCGCNYPRPYYTLIQRILYDLFGYKSK